MICLGCLISNKTDPEDLVLKRGRNQKRDKYNAPLDKRAEMTLSRVKAPEDLRLERQDRFFSPHTIAIKDSDYAL